MPTRICLFLVTVIFIVEGSLFPTLSTMGYAPTTVAKGMYPLVVAVLFYSLYLFRATEQIRKSCNAYTYKIARFIKNPHFHLNFFIFRISLIKLYSFFFDIFHFRTRQCDFHNKNSFENLIPYFFPNFRFIILLIFLLLQKQHPSVLQQVSFLLHPLLF